MGGIFVRVSLLMKNVRTCGDRRWRELIRLSLIAVAIGGGNNASFRDLGCSRLHLRAGRGHKQKFGCVWVCVLFRDIFCGLS